MRQRKSYRRWIRGGSLSANHQPWKYNLTVLNRLRICSRKRARRNPIYPTKWYHLERIGRLNKRIKISLWLNLQYKQLLAKSKALLNQTGGWRNRSVDCEPVILMLPLNWTPTRRWCMISTSSSARKTRRTKSSTCHLRLIHCLRRDLLAAMAWGRQ